LRAVLGRDTDAELGLFKTYGHANDDAEGEADASSEAREIEATAAAGMAPPAVPVAEAVAGVAMPEAMAGAAVQVNVSAQAGTAVTVVCQDYTSVYRWINKGERPRNPVPRLIAGILTQALGRPVSVADIGMGDAQDTALSEPVSMAGLSPVRVTVSAGGAIEVVCPDDSAGLVAIVAGDVRVLIDTSGTDPTPVVPAVVDEPSLPSGARVYSLDERRARWPWRRQERQPTGAARRRGRRIWSLVAGRGGKCSPCAPRTG
jgi:hypothetical protein